MRKRLLLICVIVLALLSGCLPHEQVDETSESMLELEKELFNRFSDSDSEQADVVFQQIISLIENEDRASLQTLFSAHTMDSVENMDGQVSALFDFYEGKMTSFQRYGPGTQTAKDNGAYYKTIYASYDVTTSEGDYRMVIYFCTVDSACDENVGLTSIYIIKAENSNLDFVYWGEWGTDEWSPGITIEFEDSGPVANS